MSAESATSPAEQRVLAALYTGAGLVFMGVLIWQQLDPGGPGEAFAAARDRLRSWRRDRVELAETFLEIAALPETEEPCAER